MKEKSIKKNISRNLIDLKTLWEKDFYSNIKENNETKKKNQNVIKIIKKRDDNRKTTNNKKFIHPLKLEEMKIEENKGYYLNPKNFCFEQSKKNYQRFKKRCLKRIKRKYQNKNNIDQIEKNIPLPSSENESKNKKINNTTNTIIDNKNTKVFSLNKYFEKLINKLIIKEKINYSYINTYPFDIENINYTDNETCIKQNTSEKLKIKNIKRITSSFIKIPKKISFPNIDGKILKNFSGESLMNNVKNFKNIKYNILYLNQKDNSFSKNQKLLKTISASQIYNYRHNLNQAVKIRILRRKRKGFSSLKNLQNTEDTKKQLNGKKNNAFINITPKISRKKYISLKKNVYEKVRNIYYEKFNNLGDSKRKIEKKDAYELAAHFNLDSLLSKEKAKLNECNKNISNIRAEIINRDNKILIKGENLKNNLKEINKSIKNITFHLCKQNFSLIKLRENEKDIYNSNKIISYLEEEEEDNNKINNVLNNAYQKKLKLEDEISLIHNEITIDTQEGIKYYKHLLKNGKDNRNIGLTWIVKRLLRLNYLPEIKDFPDYIDEKMYNFFISVSKYNNTIFDAFKELEEIKKELLINNQKNFSEKNYKKIEKNRKFYKLSNVKKNCIQKDLFEHINDFEKENKRKDVELIRSDKKNKIIKENYSSPLIGNFNKTLSSIQNQLIKSIDYLIENYYLMNLHPEIKHKINVLCRKGNKYFNSENINLGISFYSNIKLTTNINERKEKVKSFFEMNFCHKQNKCRKEIFNIVKRIKELKDLIENFQKKIGNLYKNIITYVKNRKIYLSSSYYHTKGEFQNIKKENKNILILRNIFGNENKFNF